MSLSVGNGLCIFYFFLKALVPIAIGINSIFLLGRLCEALLKTFVCAVACVVFKCACKMRWLFEVLAQLNVVMLFKQGR